MALSEQEVPLSDFLLASWWLSIRRPGPRWQRAGLCADGLQAPPLSSATARGLRVIPFHTTQPCGPGRESHGHPDLASGATHPFLRARSLAHSRYTVTQNCHYVCVTSPFFVLGLEPLKGKSALITPVSVYKVLFGGQAQDVLYQSINPLSNPGSTHWCCTHFTDVQPEA